ncbi:MAG: tryptophan 7-halogenase [Polyangiaceae bacterium]
MELHTAFLADASGRASRLARRRQSGPGTFALYGYFRGPALPQRPRIEARPEGWCWGVPIPDGTYNALVFLDPARVRGAGRKSLDELLKGLLEGSALGRDLVGAELVRPVRAADATPYVDEACVGPTRIRVGDAALALDPLSSSGVQKAIQTALSGAIVANTLLRRPEASLFASAFHRGAVERAAERHRAWSSEHYATGMSANRYDGAFWRARAAAAPTAAAPRPLDLPAVDCPLRFSAEAAWRDVPCLGEAFVEVQRALEHPRLDGPIAYLGGHSLTRLLEGAPDGWSARDYVRAWSKTMAPDAAASIARWLLMRGVLEPSAEPRLRGDAD